MNSELSESKSDIENNIRTFITHNKGGVWESIKAPAVNADGTKLNCYIDEGCSLHLQIYSSDG